MNYQEAKKKIKETIDSNPILKTGLYLGIGIFSIYAIGKTFSALGYAARGYRNFKNSIKPLPKP